MRFIPILLALAAPWPASAQTQAARTTAADRTSAAVTIYNQNMGLVREVRSFDVPAGELELAFEDVTAQIRPETVHVKDLGSGQTLRVLEQNYRYDVLAPSSLIEEYVGKQVTLVHVVPGTGETRTVQATLLSTGAQPAAGGYGYGYGGYGYGGYQQAYSDPWSYVYDINGDITSGGYWRIVLPAEIPAGFVSRPTLFWDVESPGAGRRTVEASYLTWGMNWKADYVLVLGADGTKGDLTGWVTLTNDSGISFEDATLKLVAGNVNVVSAPYGSFQPMLMARGSVVAADESMAGPGFVEEGMFEYHLYTLQRQTDLLDREQKQIELLSGSGIPIERHYRLYGQPYWFTGELTGIQENLHPDVWLEFLNAENVGLGDPLPAGTVRVYETETAPAGRGRAAAAAVLGRQFVGEDMIDHTAREERVKVRTGTAFDIVAERRQTDYEIIGSTAVATEWEIKIRNRKSEAVTVEVREATSGDWTIVTSSLPWTKESSREVRFDVVCPPDQEVVLTYNIRVNYY
ncbi:MAG: DUF4139 domain-containing protein [Deltaproteobacteria bacterium]|nr:DUF4139 domain-containing protein [Deltaproteobacteria bacterium]